MIINHRSSSLPALPEKNYFKSTIKRPQTASVLQSIIEVTEGHSSSDSQGKVSSPLESLRESNKTERPVEKDSSDQGEVLSKGESFDTSDIIEVYSVKEMNKIESSEVFDSIVLLEDVSEQDSKKLSGFDASLKVSKKDVSIILEKIPTPEVYANNEFLHIAPDELYREVDVSGDDSEAENNKQQDKILSTYDNKSNNDDYSDDGDYNPNQGVGIMGGSNHGASQESLGVVDMDLVDENIHENKIQTHFEMDNDIYTANESFQKYIEDGRILDDADQDSNSIEEKNVSMSSKDGSIIVTSRSRKSTILKSLSKMNHSSEIIFVAKQDKQEQESEYDKFSTSDNNFSTVGPNDDDVDDGTVGQTTISEINEKIFSKMHNTNHDSFRRTEDIIAVDNFENIKSSTSKRENSETNTQKRESSSFTDISIKKIPLHLTEPQQDLETGSAPKTKKHKTLADLCSSSSPSSAKFRVGLSRKERVGHLHSYLSK